MITFSTLGFHLHDKEFQLCLKYWLSQPMFEENSSCPQCQRPSDSYGDYQVGCGGNGDRLFSHSSLRDILFAAAHSAALAPRKEAPVLTPGSIGKLADVFFPN